MIRAQTLVLYPQFGLSHIHLRDGVLPPIAVKTWSGASLFLFFFFRTQPPTRSRPVLSIPVDGHRVL